MPDKENWFDEEGRYLIWVCISVLALVIISNNATCHISITSNGPSTREARP